MGSIVISGRNLAMHRGGILAVLALAPLVVPGQAPRTNVIHFSFYAPQQKESPVHIVAFRSHGSDLQFVVSNESDKPVIGVGLGFVDNAPEGCRTRVGARSEVDANGYSAGGFPVRITAHGLAVASGVGQPTRGTATPQTAVVHYPRGIVNIARATGAAYLQAQVGVIGVWFEDGSTWPARWPSGSPPNGPDSFFDRTLLDAEAGKCSDAVSVANALQVAKEIVFGNEITQPELDNEKGLPPHLRFSCSLEGLKAICRMPLEPAAARPETGQQK